MASLLIWGGLTTILMILWVAVPTPSVLLTNRSNGTSRKRFIRKLACKPGAHIKEILA